MPPHHLENVNDQNVQLDHYLRRSLDMDLKSYKILKNGALSLALLAFGVYLIGEGVEPTLVATSILPIIALLNGLEMSELYAAWAEIKKTQAEAESDTSALSESASENPPRDSES